MTARFGVTCKQATRFTTLQLFNFIQVLENETGFTVGVNRLRGRLFERASRDSNQSLGRFRFWRCRRCEPVAMEHVFPVECFCIARQMLDYLYVNAKESLAENAASPLAVG